MKNRYLLGCMTTAFACLSCSSEIERPNIILFYADDMGIGDLGCYGQKYIRTPYLDMLAQEGMIFTNHYSGSSVSAPSRSCLMTGLHSGHSPIRGNKEVRSDDPLEEGQYPLPSDVVTMPEVLKKAGYATGAFGKWGLGSVKSVGSPLSKGFDTFYGYADQRHAHNHYPQWLVSDSTLVTLDNPYFPINESIPEDSGAESFEKYKGHEYSLDLIVEEAKKFIRENSDRPFFVYLPVIVPHRALQVPDEELLQYEGVFDETPYYGADKFTPHMRPKSAYAAMISRMDRKLGEVMALLKELGLDEDTMLLFSSDNGPCSIGGADIDFFDSALGMKGRKRSLNEGGIKAPLIVRWPGKVPAGTSNDILCAQYDFMATFADAAGVDIPDGDGVSLLPSLLGKDQEGHQWLYWEYLEHGGQQALRFGDFKAYRDSLAIYPDRNWQIYDLSKDPMENDDLASERPEMVVKAERIAQSQHTEALVDAWNFL